MRLVIIFIFTFLSISASCQQFNDFFEDTLQRVNISTFGSYNYGSNAITSNFINTFITGEKIDDPLKQNVFGRLADQNRFGGDLNYQLNIEIPLKKKGEQSPVSLLVGVGQNEHIDSRFSRDLFKLIFDGNKQFAGETIDISGFNYSYFTYQELRVGFINHKKNKAKVAKRGVVLSVIKAEEFQDITVSRGTIFVEELGREITLDLNYAYNQSDTANQGFSAVNGLGVATDLFTQFFLKNGDKISLAIEDLGFIYWNNQSINNAADSVFNYEGIFIGNVFDLNDSLLTDISRDSIIDNIAVVNQKTSSSIAIPASLNVSYTKYFNKKLRINMGFYHKILANYFPLIYTNTYYHFSKSIAMKAHISYGGYGKLNTGLAIGTFINNKYTIFVGSNNIEGFLIPQSSYANNGYLGLKIAF